MKLLYNSSTTAKHSGHSSSTATKHSGSYIWERRKDLTGVHLRVTVTEAYPFINLVKNTVRVFKEGDLKILGDDVI